MRILIGDDHELIRKGIIQILRSRADIELAEAVNGRDAVEKARELKPDLILLDVSMPVLGGFGAAKEIKRYSPNVPILFVSVHDTNGIVDEARSAGEGIVLKGQAGITLLNAVDALLRNETFFPS
jgi:DNA-binding NarL/FixJ family response regulator